MWWGLVACNGYQQEVVTDAVIASGPNPSATVRSSERPSAAARSRAERQLRRIEKTERPRDSAGYRRDAFGSPWRDIDGNGCNQRDDVLQRDALPGSITVGRQGACEHDVLAGTFVDPYSGRMHVLDDLKDLSQAQAVQIDHVVPLAEAWVSGASGWSQERRLRYANTLNVLLAVDGPTNASKGARDPAAWRPRKTYQCAYAVHWITIKYHWQLTVDRSEARALTQMLGYC